MSPMKRYANKQIKGHLGTLAVRRHPDRLEAFHNPTKIVHDAKNPSATGATKVLVFMLIDKGQPLATPAP